MVITEVAILAAAKYFVSPMLPIKPVSTIPTNGMAKFEKKTGMDSINIFFNNVKLNYIHQIIRCYSN